MCKTVIVTSDAYCERPGVRGDREGAKIGGLYCLMTPGLSKDIRCHV